MRQIRAPFLLVNPKSYLYGKQSLDLAMAADGAAEKYGIDIFFTCPFSDLRMIKEHTKHLILTAQHMDSLVPGRGMGYVLPEALKDAGVEAVFLNHAEHPLTVSQLYKTMQRAGEMEIATIVCADSVAEGIALSRLHPSVILCEPTDLIGVGKIADDSYIREATEQIRKESPDVLVVIASSITTGDDVRKVIGMGADGTGATSGIIKAPDPSARVYEMAEAAAEFKKENDRHENV
jgi:triosephosphate isomerase